MFLLFRKDKETKCISVKISTTTTKKKWQSFHCQKYADQKYL